MAMPYDGTGGSATNVIRGIDVDKLAKGFAVEANVFKQFCTTSKTNAREIRWYKKTAGFLDSTGTTGMTTSDISNTSSLARPHVIQPELSRKTSYVRKFMAESPWLSIEDINDSDIDILATTVRDVTAGVQRKVDLRIYSVLVEAAEATPTVPNPTDMPDGASTGPGWNTVASCNPITDILTAKQSIRSFGYDPEGAVVLMNSIEHKWLMNYLINVKGSSIPAFSSDKVKTGVVMELLGCRIVVSENVTTDSVIVFVPQRTLTFKSYMPLATAILDEPGIGKKFRVWEECEVLLTDPNSGYHITNTIV